MLTVLTPLDVPCKVNDPLMIPAGKRPGYISSFRTVEEEVTCLGVPSSSYQVKLEAQPGQRINVTVLNFGWYTAKLPHAIRPTVPCVTYGHVIENGRSKTALVSCDITSREIPVYSSEENMATLSLLFRKASEFQFLIKYQGNKQAHELIDKSCNICTEDVYYSKLCVIVCYVLLYITYYCVFLHG